MAYSKRFDDALLYAADVHRDQVRKGSGIPYVTHLLGVASIVGEGGGSEDEVIAGLLHDAPEDHGGIERLEDIRERFGDRVAEIVAGCSNTYEEEKREWWARKRAYISHLANAPESVRLVSAADKLHNARAIVADLRVLGDGLWGRFTGGKDGTLWYYRELVKTLPGIGCERGCRGTRPRCRRDRDPTTGGRKSERESMRQRKLIPLAFHRRVRDSSENQNGLFEHPAPEAPSSADVVLALHTCIPDDERIERDKLFMDVARELGYPKLTKKARRSLNKALHAEDNAGRLKTDWERVWNQRKAMKQAQLG